MEFVGSTDPTGGTIPVPNVDLVPEMFSKNYNLSFLLQPIAPLLNPPTSVEAKFFINIPLLKELCVGISRAWQKRTLQIMGAGALTTAVVYGVWKLSSEWNEGIFAVKKDDSDPDTETLDEEVARILSVIPEESALSICSPNAAIKGVIRGVCSDTSSFSGRRSHCTCAACVGARSPIKELHSRIDQVMSRVEDVMSGLKVLGIHRKRHQEDGDTGEPTISSGFQVEGLDKNDLQGDMNILTNVPPEGKVESLADIHRRIKDLEQRVGSIPPGRVDKSLSPDKKSTRIYSSSSPCYSDKRAKSSSDTKLNEDNQESSPTKGTRVNNKIIISRSPPEFERMPSPHKTSCQRNLKRNILSRNCKFPAIQEECPPNRIEEINGEGVVAKEETPGIKDKTPKKGDIQELTPKSNAIPFRSSYQDEKSQFLPIREHPSLFPAIQEECPSNRKEEINGEGVVTKEETNGIKVKTPQEGDIQELTPKSNPIPFRSSYHDEKSQFLPIREHPSHQKEEFSDQVVEKDETIVKDDAITITDEAPLEEITKDEECQALPGFAWRRQETWPSLSYQWRSVYKQQDIITHQQQSDSSKLSDVSGFTTTNDDETQDDDFCMKSNTTVTDTKCLGIATNNDATQDDDPCMKCSTEVTNSKGLGDALNSDLAQDDSSTKSNGFLPSRNSIFKAPQQSPVKLITSVIRNDDVTPTTTSKNSEKTEQMVTDSVSGTKEDLPSATGFSGDMSSDGETGNKTEVPPRREQFSCIPLNNTDKLAANWSTRNSQNKVSSNTQRPQMLPSHHTNKNEHSAEAPRNLEAIGKEDDLAEDHQEQSSPKTSEVFPTIYNRTPSPFKRFLKKRNDFQVKYIPKGKSEGDEIPESTPMPTKISRGEERDDEKVVIVPDTK